MANTYTDLLKLRKPALGDVGWDDEVNDNTEIAEFVLGSILKSNVIIDGIVPSDGGGLDVDVTSGNVVVGGASFAVAADSVTCTSGVLNWVYVDDAGALQVATSQPTGDYVAIALVDAGSTTITRFGDARNHAEGALTIGVTHTPENYAEDTTKTGAINQHLAGVDNQLGFMGGFKNKLINGGFDIWQRATSQTSNGYGSDDRWRNSSSGSTKTHSRQSFAPGQTDVPGNPKYFSRTEVTVAGTAANYTDKKQRIEDVRTFAGQTATLSLWAKADSNKNIAVEFRQEFGSGGTPSATVSDIGITTFALTTTWQKFTTTVTFPSLTGKTIGTNEDSDIRVGFWFNAGSNYDAQTNSLGNQTGTFDLAQIQLEAGEVATPFEQRDIGGTELRLCQRYYNKSYSLDDAPGSAVGTGMCYALVSYGWATRLRPINGDFKVRMRASPTISLWSRSGTTNWVSFDGNNTDSFSVSAKYADEGRVSAIDIASGATVNDIHRFHWTAEAEL